jgi:hypothetical protein
MSANWLQEKSWPQVAKYLESDNRILLPVGSTQHHGIFSPLGTDSIRAEVRIEVLSDLIKDLAKTLAGTGDCGGYAHPIERRKRQGLSRPPGSPSDRSPGLAQEKLGQSVCPGAAFVL